MATCNCMGPQNGEPKCPCEMALTRAGIFKNDESEEYLFFIGTGKEIIEALDDFEKEKKTTAFDAAMKTIG